MVPNGKSSSLSCSPKRPEGNLLVERGQGTQEVQGSDPSDASAPQHETVEEVFGLESGWSVEVLGNDNGKDDLMLIGSEVHPQHTDPPACT